MVPARSRMSIRPSGVKTSWVGWASPVIGVSATKFGGLLLATVTEIGLDAALFPDASLATALSVCGPFAAVVVSQLAAYGGEASSAPRFWPSSLNCTPATA